MNKINRIAAVALAGIMCMQVSGCAKKSAQKESLDIYDAQIQAVLEHSISDSKIIEDTLYATYYDIDEVNCDMKCGILKYDFATKELLTSDLDMNHVSIKSFFGDIDGNIVILGQKYQKINDEAEGDENGLPNNVERDDYSYTNVEFVYDTNLNLISKNESELTAEELAGNDENEQWTYSQTTLSDGRKISSHMREDGSACITICDADGNETGRIDLETESNGLYEFSDGTVATVIKDDKGEALYQIDIDAKKIGDKIVDTSEYHFDTLYEGNDSKMMFVSLGYLYAFDYKTTKVDKILKFADSDINFEHIKLVFQLGDGTLGVLVTNDDYTEAEIDYLIKQDSSSILKKKEITIGTFNLDNELQEDIIKFNKTNDTFKIVVKEYCDEKDDYDTAITKFDSDIVSGNCPDIIDFSQMGASLYKYVKKGVLQEISSYIENDSEISETDFLPGIIDGYKIDGKLYTFPQYFAIEGFVGATKTVGKNINWTLEEFISLAESLPEDTEIIENITRDSLLGMLCTYNLDEYVDWSTGKCSFDNGKFIKVLEFCKKYKSSDDYYENYDYNEIESEVTNIRNGKILLRNCYLNNFEEYMVSKVIYGEDINFKGYPSSRGNGISVSSVSPMLAISSNSDNKDAAWEFIRQYYLPENSKTDNNKGFPSRLNELENVFNEMTQTHYDDEGKENNVMTSCGFNDIELDVPYPDEDDIEAIKQIFNSIDTVSFSDNLISEIISDEAEAFFSGQKTVQEVIDVIQSRVSLYVKENR